MPTFTLCGKPHVTVNRSKYIVSLTTSGGGVGEETTISCRSQRGFSEYAKLVVMSRHLTFPQENDVRPQFDIWIFRSDNAPGGHSAFDHRFLRSNARAWWEH